MCLTPNQVYQTSSIASRMEINLDTAEYEGNRDANLYKPSEKNKFNLHMA